MRLSTSLALIAVGAILAYAVEVVVPGVDLGVAGTVLLLVGILGLLVTLGLEGMRRRPSHALFDRTDGPHPEPRPAPREARVPREPAYDPVVGEDRPRRFERPAPEHERTQVAPKARARPR